MVDHNPYAAPASDAAPRAHATLEEDRVLTPEIVEAMAQTRPWVLLVSILGFVASGILLLAGVGLFAFGTFAGAGVAGPAAIIYVGLAAAFVYPSLCLFRYAASIKMMQQGYGVHALADALRQQKSYWRLTGILALVVAGLNLIAFVAGVVSAM
jgi:hypothetical protein